MKLKVKDLWVKLGGLTVLRGINLEVNKGESVAIIGRNGAGKTTLMRTIMGILKPDKGEITLETNVNTYRITKMKPYNIAKLGMGYVPQGRMIFPDLTVLENLEIVYGSPVPDDILEWLFNIFPELKKVKDRRGIHLSGGEQQMLAIARALICKPKLLLLDEPLEGLAPRAAKSLKNTLEIVRSEGVSLLITEAGNVNRLRGLVEKAYGIDRGEIVYGGNLEGILKDPIARARIWGI